MLPIMTGKTEELLIEWLHTALRDGQNTPEQEIRCLFLEMEQSLQQRGLLRSDFKKYRNLHFSQLCRDVFRHSDFLTHRTDPLWIQRRT